MDRFDDHQVLHGWQLNAQAWTRAVRERRIENRRLVTDRALLEVVERLAPTSAIDLGCGEGWLVRELLQRGIDAEGVDAVPALLEAAHLAGPGRYSLASYEAIAAGEWQSRAVDLLVCNFSLIGRQSVEGLFRIAGSLLTANGRLVVQTLHPLQSASEQDYRDGWREGSWDGCGTGFDAPPPWYFRTLQSWFRLFSDNQLQVCELIEPLHPNTGRPASVIFIARPTSSAAHLENRA